MSVPEYGYVACEVFPIEDITPVMKSWLEQWRPGDLNIAVSPDEDLSGMPKPPDVREAFVFGIPLYRSVDIEPGTFQIGLDPTRADDAKAYQRWRHRNAN